MLSKRYISMNKVTISIVLFLIMFSIIHFIKPVFIYNEDGSYRPFGLGYKNKTVIPIWVVSISLAIFSYLAVLYYILHF